MRLNFTGRRKIEKGQAHVAIRDDPGGSGREHYFELALDLSTHGLPPTARVFVEAFRKETLMRFDFGTVAALATPTPAQSRLRDFGSDPDGVRFRVKVTQPDGPDAGKLLAEADNLAPDQGTGVTPLIQIAGDDGLGPTPWRLEVTTSQPRLPTLFINTQIGGKSMAVDPIGKPLLLTAAVREIFAALVNAGEEDDPEHWVNLWRAFATDVLHLLDPVEVDAEDQSAVDDWVEQAVNAFATEHDLAGQLAAHMAATEALELEEVT